MALFKRSNNNPVVLPEIEKYYDAERRERSGLTWLLAFVSVAAAALILIGIFYGGRLLYRAATTGKTKPVVTVQNDTQTTNKKPVATTKPKTDEPATTPNPTPTPAPSESTPFTPQPSNTPNAAPVPSSLTNTGPEDVLPYFFLSTILGVYMYRLHLRRKQSE